VWLITVIWNNIFLSTSDVDGSIQGIQHTWPVMVHPNNSFCAQGAPFGPFLNARTFSRSVASRPSRMCTPTLSSLGGISWAMSWRWGKLCSRYFLLVIGKTVTFYKRW
jgi:hypothetical protein